MRNPMTVGRTSRRNASALRRAWVAAAVVASAVVAAVPSSPVEALPVLDLVSIQPARLLETRVGPTEKTVDGEFEGIGRAAAGSTTEVVVAGRGGVPATATSAFLNVTAISPSAGGFLTVFPCGSPRPLASNVNYVAGDIVPNAVLAKIGVDGKVCIYTLAAADIIADVNGFVPLGGSPESVSPARILETRVGPTEKTVDGEFEGIGAIGAGETLTLDVVGRGGVPDDADGVFVNLTAVTPDAPGFLTVYPCDEQRPTASNVNYVAGDVVPNVVLAKISGAGTICIFSQARTDVVADVNGYVADGRTPNTVNPSRILETRSGAGLTTVDGQFQGIGLRGAGSTLELDVAGRGGVPADASAVFLNVTAVTPGGPGFVTVYPCGEDRPLTSNVNYVAGDVVPNSVLAKIGEDGKVCLFTLAATHLVVDVSGEVPQPSVKGLVDASVGASHACALDDEGGVTCWGVFFNGELGVGEIPNDGSNSVLPVTNPDLDVEVIAAGVRFTCAALADGGAACWGFNARGQLGDGTTTTRFSPTPVSGLTDVVDISAGREHACALRSNGDVWCWGDNGSGKLGDGSSDDSLVPVRVQGLSSPAIGVDVGRNHTCALLDDRTVECWGSHSLSPSSTLTPIQAVGMADVVQIEAGEGTTCGRISDGTVDCWGARSRLGNGDQGPGSTPTPQTVAGLTGVVDLTVGFTTLCAAIDDGSAECWGSNSIGQVGNGVVGGDPVLSPVAVAGIDGDVVRVHAATDGSSTCATLADTSVVCWGRNSDKQLGALTPGTNPRGPSATPLVVGSSGLGPV